MFPTVKEVFQVVTTFALTCFAWIFFRSKDMGQAMGYIQGIFSHPFYSKHFVPIEKSLFLILGVFFVLEWLFRNGMPEFVRSRNAVSRAVLYYGLVLLIVLFGAFGKDEFIYFQF
jgi:hypothetical protein